MRENLLAPATGAARAGAAGARAARVGFARAGRLLGRMVGDAQDLDLEKQGLACQAVIEVHHEFIGLDGQNGSGNGAMGAGEPEFLTHLDGVVAIRN